MSIPKESLAYRQLAAEVMGGRPVFLRLDEQLRLEVEEGIAAMVMHLDSVVGGLWNRVHFMSSDNIRVDGQPDFEGFGGMANPLREKIKNQGIRGHIAAAMINGSVGDTILMMQFRVNTIAELNQLRGRHKRLSSGVKSREFHSNEIGPSNQRRTSLHIGKY